MEMGLSYDYYLRWLKQESDFYKKNVISAIRDLFETVSSLHPYLVHCDLKPANILIVMRDGKFTPVLIDFNVSHIVRKSKLNQSSNGMTQYAQHGGFFGTLEYLPPELPKLGENAEKIKAVTRKIRKLKLRNSPDDVEELENLRKELEECRKMEIEQKNSKMDVYSLGRMIVLNFLNAYICDSRPPHMKNEQTLGDLGLSNKNQKRLFELVSACVAEEQEKRPPIRKATEEFYWLCLREEEAHQRNEFDIFQMIAEEILKTPVEKCHPIESDNMKRFRPSRKVEGWLYPEREEFFTLIGKQLLPKGKTIVLEPNTYVVTSPQSAYRYYPAGEPYGEILQQIYLLTDKKLDETAKSLLREIDSFRNYENACHRTVKIYDSFSVFYNDGNNQQDTLNIGGKNFHYVEVNGEKIPFIAIGRECGLSYINYMKWLFNHTNHAQLAIHAVYELFTMMKELHESGFVHGNICAENIQLVYRRGNFATVLTGEITNMRGNTMFSQKIREDIRDMSYLACQIFDEKLSRENIDPKRLSSQAKGFGKRKSPISDLLKICFDMKTYPNVTDTDVIQIIMSGMYK